MIPLAILRKILLSLVPLALFYLLRKMGKEPPKGKLKSSDFDPSTDLRASKSRIIEGEIVEEK